MNDLKNTTKIVKAILEEDEQARNSDSFLYLKVLDVYGEKNGIDIKSMSITTFLLHLREFGFPPFESVRRARQKVQHNFPHLAACGKVGAMREVNEQEFRVYAKRVITE